MTTDAGGERLPDVVDAQIVAPHGHPCRTCGCPVEADDRFCPACGATNELHGAPGGAAQNVGGSTKSGAIVTSGAETSETRDAKFFRCQQCGSEVSVEPDQRSYVCAFCDSSYVVEFAPEESGRRPPEFVIGFQVSKDEAQEKFRAWLASSGWFRPGDLRRSAVVDRLRGVYLPFWTFAMLAESQWSARIGEYWYRMETYTETDANGKTTTRTRQVRETEWWNLAGFHHRYYSGYLVSGSRGLPQAEANQIGPFHLPALRRYAPHYLAGWACEEYSVVEAEAQARCRQQFANHVRDHVAAFLPGDTHADLRVATDFRQVSADLCLLPVHVLTYRYGGKLYRFLVNGQTGRVTGERPVSWLRILLFVVVVVAVVALVTLVINVLGSRS